METILVSVVLEGIVSRLIENLRKSSTCRTECEKLEQVVKNNRPKLERLARELDRSKQNGKVWVALDEWCEEMKDLLERADVIVHECQSGSRPYNFAFSAPLATRIAEIRNIIEDKLNHSTTLETTLEQTAYFANIALQQSQFLAVNTMHHGCYMVQTTSAVASLQYSPSMPHLQTMHSWNQHNTWESPGTSPFHHSQPEVGMSTVEHERRHSFNDLSIPGSNQWRNDFDDIDARAQATRAELHRRNSISVFPHYATPETYQDFPSGPPVQFSTPPMTSQYVPSGPPLHPCNPVLYCPAPQHGAPYSIMYSYTQ